MLNLCFMGREAFLDYTPLIFKDIKEKHDKDAKGVIVVLDSKEEQHVKSRYGDLVEICVLSDFMNAHWDEFTLEKLCEYEKKYDAAPMWKYIYTDRFLINRDYDYCVHTAAGLFAFWEYVFTTYHIDFYFDEVIATLFSYAGYLVGKKLGAHYYSLLLMRSVGMDLTHHYILNEPFEMIYNMPDDYLDRQYTDEQLKQAEEYLDSFEEKHSKPAFMNFSGKVPRFKASFLAALCKKNKKLICHLHNNSPWINGRAYLRYGSFSLLFLSEWLYKELLISSLIPETYLL